MSIDLQHFITCYLLFIFSVADYIFSSGLKLFVHYVYINVCLLIIGIIILTVFKLCFQLECKVNSYDLTPIQGSYVIANKGVKYFINLCKVGEGGIGGQMELNGKNVVSNTNFISSIV